MLNRFMLVSDQVRQQSLCQTAQPNEAMDFRSQLSMKSWIGHLCGSGKVVGFLALVVLMVGFSASNVHAQAANNGTNNNGGTNNGTNNNGTGNNVFFGNVVGGVLVDPSGRLNTITGKIPSNVERFLLNDAGQFNQAIGQGSEIRKISLKSLNAILAKIAKSNKLAAKEGRALQPIPAEVRYMGGITRIEYVYYDQKNNDIIVAGKAEQLAATKGRYGLFGVKTNLPAIHLEDFVTALRTSKASGTGNGISVSIDPTDQSRVAFRRITKLASQRNISNKRLIAQLEKEMGDQDVVLTGLPKNSRAASILALADYEMKLISMGHKVPQIKNKRNLPSFPHMLRKKRLNKALSPRFWMAMDYDTMHKNEAGNIWRLRGQAVKTMTEDNFVSATGESKGNGKRNPIAQKWADKMTAQYSELMKGQPVFGELRNFFDMAVVAALIEKEQLLEKSGLELASLYGKNDDFTGGNWRVPTKVPTKGNLLNSKNGMIVTASGGVQLDPWAVLEKVEIDNEIQAVAASPRNIKRGFYWD